LEYRNSICIVFLASVVREIDIAIKEIRNILEEARDNVARHCLEN